MKVLEYFKDGKWHRVSTGYSGGSNGTTSVPVVEVSGENWRQIEASTPISEPYLNEYGWKCCEDDGEKAKELYRWIYRCIFESLTVPMRTIEINGQEIAFVTDGKREGVEEINADIVAKRNYYNDQGKLIPAGERIVNRIMSDDLLSYLRIPVFQFGLTDETKLYTIVQRVTLDNPMTMFPLYPCDPDSIAVIKDENEVCQYFYSCVPVETKRCQTREIVNEHIIAICGKIKELYGIKVGGPLTVDQKAKVCKVIHDYLIDISNVVGGAEGETIPWALSTPYAVFDHRYQGNCMSYTNAFCTVARMYGIEALYMTGFGYIDTNIEKEGYELDGTHAWVLVRLSDEAYGTYPSDASKWSCIDVYYDERDLGIATSGSAEVSWKYFLNISEINILEKGATTTAYSWRYVDMTSGYNALPTKKPMLSMPYSGEQLYTWED